MQRAVERPRRATQRIVEIEEDDACAASTDGGCDELALRSNGGFEDLVVESFGGEADPSAPIGETTWKPRNVLFVSWRDLANPTAGGSELLVHQLASGMSQRGYHVSLLCGGPVQPKSQYLVTDAGGQYSQYLRVPVHYLRRFRSADLVVEVTNGMPFFSPLWRRGPIICFINHVHTEQWSSRFGPVTAAVGRAIEADVMPWVHRKNLVVTVSESSRASLLGLGIPENRIRMIPQGVAEPPPLVEKRRPPRFVAVGRIVGYKRIDLLLEMWQSVKQQTGGTLTIIGDGPERMQLQSKNVEDVEFTGFISEEEKHRLMTEALVLVHPASWEGWGLVITEAAVRGTPAVGFDVPGVRDAIVDGETGLLAADPESFKRDWVRLAQDQELYRRLREFGMKRSLSYPVSATVNKFESIAAEAVQRHYERSATARYRAKFFKDSPCQSEAASNP